MGTQPADQSRDENDRRHSQHMSTVADETTTSSRQLAPTLVHDAAPCLWLAAERDDVLSFARDLLNFVAHDLGALSSALAPRANVGE